MPEIVVRWIGDEATEADGQREEALSDGGVPDLGLKELAPVGFDEEKDAIHGALKRQSPGQQGYHDHVREEGKKVGRFAGTLHAPCQYPKYTKPGQQEAEAQMPIGQAQTVLDVWLLS